MISYAQNREDVVLARALPDPDGFYIDVGAASPTAHSVTKHFYDRGWRGVNIEPIAHWQTELAAERPRDVNLGIGLSDAPGTLTLYDASELARGESTFDAEVAEALTARGLEVEEREVEVRTLADVCAEHAGERPIDFLKVDVEGWELPVLRGGDWERFRPRVLVVESTFPGTEIDVSQETSAFLADMGYTGVLFDGLNRYYAEDAALLEALAVPANVLDDYTTAEEAGQAARLASVERELAGMRAAWERLETAAAAAAASGQRAHAAEDEAAHLRALVAEVRVAARVDLVAAQREAADARLQMEAMRDALERVAQP